MPLEIRTEPMESEDFRNWIREQNNLWIYCSNITEFHYFDLEFADPSNVVIVQIIFPGLIAQVLDLAPLSGGPVKVTSEFRSRRKSDRKVQVEVNPTYKVNGATRPLEILPWLREVKEISVD